MVAAKALADSRCSVAVDTVAVAMAVATECLVVVALASLHNLDSWGVVAPCMLVVGNATWHSTAVPTVPVLFD